MESCKSSCIMTLDLISLVKTLASIIQGQLEITDIEHEWAFFFHTRVQTKVTRVSTQTVATLNTPGPNPRLMKSQFKILDVTT